MWETPVDGLRMGISGLVLRLNEAAFLPAYALTESVRATLYGWVASIEYVAHDLQIAAEYAQSRSETRELTPAPMRLPTVVASGGYGLASYRVSRWFQPGAYFSFLYANRNLGSQSDNGTTNDENIQDDLAGTLRFDVNNYWIVKLEAHYMHGTDALTAPISPTAPVNWGLFLIKTTGYF
jgi:hypothetical protein